MGRSRKSRGAQNPRSFDKIKRKPNSNWVKKAPTHPQMSALRTAEYAVPLNAPFKRVRHMLYHTSASLTGTTGVVDSHVYQANGAYDPDVTGVGHQPMYFDNLMACYEHFVVQSATISVRFHNWSTTVPATCGVYISPDSTPLSDNDRIIENGQVKTQVLGVSSNSHVIKTLNLSCDILREMDKLNVHDMIDDEKMTGSAAANPVEGTYFIVYIQSWDLASTSSAIADITISMDVTFFEPRKVALSLPLGVKLTPEQRSHLMLSMKEKRQAEIKEEKGQSLKSVPFSRQIPPCTSAPENLPVPDWSGYTDDTVMIVREFRKMPPISDTADPPGKC